MNDPIPARAVRALLEEILAVLDGFRPDQFRVVHVVTALRRLCGPQMTAGDVDSVTAALHSALAAVAAAGPPAYDPANGPYATREQAEAAYAYLARGAESGTLAGRTQLLAESVIDAIDNFAATGAYDRQLAARLAGLLAATDMGVIGSWIRRAAGDRPDPNVHVVNPDLRLPEAGQ